MKNFILLLLLITVTKFYAQNESFTLKNKDFLKVEKSKTIILGSNYTNNIDEILNFESTFIESNSEGKFLKYSFNDAKPSIIEGSTEFSTNSNSLKEKSVTVILKEGFIEKMTQKFSNKIINAPNSTDDYFKYDKEIITDKFNKVVYDKDVTIQIGKNIYEYINKLYKSDIDKTFVNELNLVVVNF